MNGSYFLWCCNVFTTSTFLRMYYLHFQKCVHPGDSSAHRLKRGANLPSSSLISPYHLNQFATQRRLQVGSLNLLVISNSALGNHVRWQETCRKEKDIFIQQPAVILWFGNLWHSRLNTFIEKIIKSHIMRLLKSSVEFSSNSTNTLQVTCIHHVSF